MLSADEHPGIITFLLGMIVVVMVGLGLASLIERRFRFSSSQAELESLVDQDAKTLDELRGRHSARSRQVAAVLPHRLDVGESHAALLQRLEQGAAVQANLAAERADLESEVAAMEEEFARYRADYRRGIWAAAVGEHIPLLRANGGREYRDATITRVTEVGLEVKYADGMARIEAPALGPEWQQRMQWNDEERRALLAEERRASAAAAKPAPPPPATPPAEVNAALRARVTLARAKVAALRRELATATSNQYRGGKRSVPGSLETWDAQARRLTAELEQAELEYEQAKARLRAMAPGDILLQQGSNGLRAAEDSLISAN